MAEATLCAKCSNSIFCPTWGEWKCTELQKRIYKNVTACKDFVKRPKNWKEMPCRCEDCQINENLRDDNESED